ncbi:MAG: hypothetical protein K0S29_894 [Gammaproteobacteria bacterium]|jgi:hypothetical protein|nr:hypothetical protein [Gammaproteobacteria bacterium]
MNGNDFRTKMVSPDLILPRLETIIGTDTFVKGSVAEGVLTQAREGRVNSINNLAGIYAQGLHWMPADFTKAKQLYELAAEFGNPAAAWNLAGHYQFGEGWDKDLNKAKYWYMKAWDLDPRPEEKVEIEAKIAEIDSELAAEGGTGVDDEAPRKQSNPSHGSSSTTVQSSDVGTAESKSTAISTRAEPMPFSSGLASQPSGGASDNASKPSPSP